MIDPSNRVKVTLVWTDAPGTVGPNATLVNDLDLVVSAGGRRYLGNVLTGGTSRVGGSADKRNNVESVILPAGTDGRFSVKVTGATSRVTACPGLGDATDQDFALVVSNASAPMAWPHLTRGRDVDQRQRRGADGDGALEPGETVSITERLRNDGAAPATSITGSLSGAGGVTVQQGMSAFASAPDRGLPRLARSPTGFARRGSCLWCRRDRHAQHHDHRRQSGARCLLTLAHRRAGPATSTSSSCS